jgi:hypothetical protein
MENGPFIDDFPIKTSIYKGFSMAMLNNQMVTWLSNHPKSLEFMHHKQVKSEWTPTGDGTNSAC